MAITDWIGQIKTEFESVMTAAVTAITDIKSAGQVYNYDEWPATIFTTPSTVIGLREGNSDYSLGGPLIDMHEVIVRVYLPQITLANAQKIAVQLVPLVRNEFAANITLSGLVDHCIPSNGHPFYEGPGTLAYGDKEYSAIIFNFEIKENVSGDFTPAASS